MTATELYNQSIKSLPAAQRLELAKLILEDIPSQSVVDYKEEWSEEDYHRERPDVVVGLLTTKISAAKASTYYLLQDWGSAGLHSPSAFRCFFVTVTPSAVRTIGHLSDRDWQAVRDRVSLAFA